MSEQHQQHQGYQQERTSAPTAWESVGGATGLAQSAIPSAVFVLADESFGLRIGIAVALGVGVAFAALRLARKQPLRPVIGSFVGLAVSSYLAWRTGSARDYFLPDIWFSLVSSCVLTLSIVIGRPLVGVAWTALNGRGSSRAWRHDRPSLVGCQLATATLAVMYAIRFGVQHWLYERQNAGRMFVAKLLINYPLWALALVVVTWAVRRSDRRLAESAQGSREEESPPSVP